jgi:GxxExxY protein
MEDFYIEEIAKQIVHSAFSVHKALGPGLLESIYQDCLVQELSDRNIMVKSEVQVPVHYKGKQLNKDLRLDLLVEDQVIIEVKAVEVLMPVHVAQILSYLKLSDKRLGFLINFNVPLLKDGIRRIVNNL